MKIHRMEIDIFTKESKFNTILKRLNEIPHPPFLAYIERMKHLLKEEIILVYGCPFELTVEGYKQNCGIYSFESGMMGMSLEMVQEWECSICGKNALLCSHKKKTLYHGELMVRTAKNIEFLGIALVDNPDMPEMTYIHPAPISEEKLEEILGEENYKIFKNSGIPLRCLICRDIILGKRKSRRN